MVRQQWGESQLRHLPGSKLHRRELRNNTCLNRCYPTGLIARIYFALASVMGSIFLAANEEAASTVVLASAHQIREMTPAEASRSLPVRIQGIVVQGIRPRPEALVLWDGSEAIYVQAPGAVGAAIKHGQRIEIEGVTGAGGFAPIIVARKIKVLSLGELPDPVKTTVSDVSAGGYDANWVELEAIVHGFVRVDDGSSVGSIGDLGSENTGDHPTWILDIEGGDS